MADLTLNRYIASGTTTQRLAFTPSPASPSSGPSYGEIWWDTDLQALYAWNAGTAAWVAVSSTAPSASAAIVQVLRRTDGNTRVALLNSGGGSGGITQLTSDVMAGPGSGSQAATIANSAVTLAKIANASANSVLVGSGSAGSGSAYAEIALGTGLSMSGTTLSSTGGSAGFVLLEQHTASTSATLDFTTAITSTYDDYRVEIIGLVPATNNTDLQMLVSTNGGSTWANSGYAWMRDADFIGGSGMAGGSSSSDTQFVLFPGLDNSIADASADATISIKHPGNATLSTVYFGQMTVWYQPSSPRFYPIVLIGGKWRTQMAVNAIQFRMSSGNITSGTIRVYGLAK